MKRFFKFLLKFLILLLITVILAFGAFQYLVPGVHVERDTALGDSKLNAAWLAHEWVSEPHSREEIHSLLGKLMTNKISLVFMHTGPIDSDGTIPRERYRYAESFLKTAKELAPDMKFHSWIGQVRSELPIEDTYIRGNIVREAVFLTQEIGFEGIHLNIEPMNQDHYFSLLAMEVYNALAVDDFKPCEVSVAITPIVPNLYRKVLRLLSQNEEFLGYDLDKAYNDLAYVKHLAEHVDYIVLMGYDTGFQDIDTYQWFLEQELIFLTKAAPGKAILGLPTYEDSRLNFNSEVENIENGLGAVLHGLSNVRVNPDNLVGLALYSLWTTDSSEWDTWQEMWLNKGH